MRSMMVIAALLCSLGSPGAAFGQRREEIRPIPPKGAEIPAEARKEVEEGLARLGEQIEKLKQDATPETLALLPDVQIYAKAVGDALKYDEFFKADEHKKAAELIAEGAERAGQLAEGKAPWTAETGLVVRGYVSKIDGSVQPYGLVVPESYRHGSGRKHRLDIWYHGRGETLSEVNFLDERRKRAGQFTPADTIVLHPYGRYCNAFKFAGETDVYEALDSVRSRYAIDDDRIGTRGFSMGGAAAWQSAVHDPGRWFAANPGAGFAESARFMRLRPEQIQNTPWYERRLWRLYDATDWAANLIGLPTVAYSGEKDGQKQAADVMAEALKPLGVELTHILGPDTEHKYEPNAATEVERRMDLLAEIGRADAPSDLRFVTYTLRYNKTHWLTIDGLDEHWERADVSAGVDGEVVEVQATNVSALTVEFPPGSPLTAATGAMAVIVDGQEITGPLVGSDRSWRFSVHREGTTWKAGPAPADGLRKKHGLQGPIDDAFMDSFVFVLPTGESRSAKVGEWVEAESGRAIREWRSQFRGEARVRKDTEVTEEDIAGSNLIVWGDPGSNAYLKSVVDRLPIAWGPDSIRVGDREFPAEGHAVVLVCPNPMNPGRYLVLNSGPTPREAHYLSNARQTPKLPDWAIVDVSTPPDPYRPGEVVAADFFGERWEVRSSRDANMTLPPR
jgi:hypothetical protein